MVIVLILFLKSMRRKSTLFLAISIWHCKEANRKNGEHGTNCENAQRFNKDLDQQSLSLFSNACVLQTPTFKIHFLCKYDGRDCQTTHLKMYESSSSTRGQWRVARQYHHNTKVKITRRGLETTKPHTKETFSAFISRWRAKAAQMTIRPNEEEQILMIVNNLLPNYQAYICPLLCLTLKHYSQLAHKWRMLSIVIY